MSAARSSKPKRAALARAGFAERLRAAPPWLRARAKDAMARAVLAGMKPAMLGLAALIVAAGCAGALHGGLELHRFGDGGRVYHLGALPFLRAMGACLARGMLWIVLGGILPIGLGCFLGCSCKILRPLAEQAAELRSRELADLDLRMRSLSERSSLDQEILVPRGGPSRARSGGRL